MKDSIKKSKSVIYWALIVTFTVLYVFVGGVSLFHAIEFFEMANNRILAILLATGFEIGQMAILFSLLMTHNKNRGTAWIMMILLTAVQITGNVFASFKYMETSGNNDWQYWQRSILFWLEQDSPEMYKVTIAWITGAILPVIALGMTALVADNIKLTTGEIDEEEYYEEDDEEEYYEENEEVDDRPSTGREEDPEEYIEPKPEDQEYEEKEELLEEEIQYNNESEQNIEKTQDEGSEKKEISKIEPGNKPRGWHLKKRFVDNKGNIFIKGEFAGNIAEESSGKK